MGVYNYGAAPTYVKIASYTATTSTASYTFSNIPQGYTDLILVTSGIGSATTNLECYINADTGSNYSFTYLYGDGSTVASGRNANANRIVVGRLGTGTSHGIAHFQNYSNSLINKTIITRKGKGSEIGMIFSNIWRNNNPITSLQIFGEGGQTMSSGYTATIYGVKAALVPKATGGDLITTNGTYWYHTFRNSGVFFPNQSLSCDYLVVAGGAGGGGGGGDSGGGGGAGGLRSTVTATGGGGTLESALSLTSQSYTVTIGAGGTGGLSARNLSGGNGSNSVFSTITSIGGGGGGGYKDVGGAYGGTTGGSGGGGHDGSAGPGSGTANQGYAGGAGSSSSTHYVGGGGGGAGAVGGTGVSSTGIAGAGGSGVAISAFATPTSTGVSSYYAGGGGGSANPGTAAGAGGAGGGGAGATGTASASVGTRATVNTGSGGGGGSTPGGGAGGSGIVIVRYAV
jgi:hypothetical protein